MARLAIVAVLLIGALCSANATMKLCEPNGIPLSPRNPRVKSNVYDSASKYAKITLEWENPTSTNPAAGCTDFYRVQRFVNGKMVAEDGPVLSSPIASPVTHTISQRPGETVSFKVKAMNKAQKASPLIDVPGATVAASAPSGPAPGTTKPAPEGNKPQKPTPLH